MSGVQLLRAGAEVRAPRPGDLFLTHGSHWTSAAIRVGQRLRYHGPDRRYAWWNHAGAFLTPTGDTAEATGSGVMRRHIRRYRDRDYVVVRIDATDADRAQMVRFYEQQIAQRSRYGYLTLASIALCLLSGAKVVFTISGSDICSGLCAAGLARGEYILPQSSVHTMPADLAKLFDAPGPDDPWWL